jgi:hypothetical protein
MTWLACSVLALWGLEHEARSAEAPARTWEPGESTTSKLPGEVVGRSTKVDGVYGRFDGDLEIALSLGGEWDFDPDRTRAAAGLGLYYYSTAGLAFRYRDAFGDRAPATPRAADPVERVLSMGIELKPLFLPRWVLDLERGPALLDLTLDSLTLGLFAFFQEESNGGLSERYGFEAGLGFGVPLLGRADGPWIETRGALRFADDGSRHPSVLVALAWHTFVLTPIVDR